MAAKPIPVPKELVKLQHTGVKLATSLEREVDTLSIADEDDYQAADILLGDIGRALQKWGALIQPVLGPLDETIRAAKKAKEGAANLDKSVRQPLEAMESTVRTLMSAYQREKILKASRDARKLEEKAITTGQRANTAPTQARPNLAKTVELLQDQAAEIRAEAKAKPVVDNTTTRVIQKCRVADADAFVRGILEGTIPGDAIVVNEGFLANTLKTDPATVKGWPGVEIYDDVVIVRK